MSLFHFHRVLIAAAIVFDFVLTFWAIQRYNNAAEGEGAGLLFMAIGSSVFTIMLVTYLVYFNRNLAVMRHRLSERQQLSTGTDKF